MNPSLGKRVNSRLSKKQEPIISKCFVILTSVWINVRYGSDMDLSMHKVKFKLHNSLVLLDILLVYIVSESSMLKIMEMLVEGLTLMTIW